MAEKRRKCAGCHRLLGAKSHPARVYCTVCSPPKRTPRPRRFCDDCGAELSKYTMSSVLYCNACAPRHPQMQSRPCRECGVPMIVRRRSKRRFCGLCARNRKITAGQVANAAQVAGRRSFTRGLTDDEVQLVYRRAGIYFDAIQIKSTGKHTP